MYRVTDKKYELRAKENLGKILQDYDFISGVYLGYGGRFLSLEEVVCAMGELCDDNW